VPGELAGLFLLEPSQIPSAVSHRVRRRHAVYDGGQVDGNGLPRFGSLSATSASLQARYDAAYSQCMASKGNQITHPAVYSTAPMYAPLPVLAPVPAVVYGYPQTFGYW
jgi:hypothetical protein